MIPVTLKLRNFLSYGEDVAPLDFTGFDVACISGKNGHGKSALFDAVTWALWGEARKAGSERKADAGLVRSGAQETSVEFVFDLQGSRYRVIRTFRRRPSGGIAGLELQVYDPTANRYQTLSEAGSVRQTQKRIHSLLGMGYDTFVNSALLLQGQADAFTRRSPSDRKAILSKILELGRYDQLAEAARARLSEVRANTRDFGRQLMHIEEASQRLDTLSDQQREEESRLSRITKEASGADRDLSDARIQVANYDRTRSNLSQARAERQRLGKEVKEVQNQIGAARQRRILTEHVLNEAEGIHSRFEELEALQRQSADLSKQQIAFAKATAEMTAVEAEIDRARQAALHEVELCRSTEAKAAEALADVESTLSRSKEVNTRFRCLQALKEEEAQMCRNLVEHRRIQELLTEAATRLNQETTARKTRLAALQEEAERLCTLASELPELERQVARLQARKHESLDLRSELEDLEKQRAFLRTQLAAKQARLGVLEPAMGRVDRQARDLAEARGDCPVCGSELDGDHRTVAIERIEKDREALIEEQKSIRTEITLAESDLTEAGNQIDILGESIASHDGDDEQLAETLATQKHAHQAAETFNAIRAKVSDSETDLQDFESSSSQARACADLEEALETIGYDVDTHDRLRSEIQETAAVEVERHTIEEALADKPARVAEWEASCRRTAAAVDAAESDAIDPEVKNRLLATHARLEGIGYDESHHNPVEARIESLADAPDALERLECAEKDLATTDIQIETLEAQLETLRPRFSECEKLVGELEEELERNEISPDRLQELESRVLHVHKERDAILDTAGGLRHDAERCRETISRRSQIKDEKKQADHDATLYEHLVTAFGRDGIPALIIEQTIPELEAETNALLARLAGDQTRIVLDPMRTLKGGCTRESFDIRISDDKGERPYELYSGGEAFRVDFALRIALSRLLARRSGAPLQTLVIDEGFGTQDSEGVDRLVDAIEVIRGDFQKILVISHVEAIKDAFPVTIAVTKTADRGSTFGILGSAE